MALFNLANWPTFQNEDTQKIVHPALPFFGPSYPAVRFKRSTAYDLFVSSKLAK